MNFITESDSPSGEAVKAVTIPQRYLFKDLLLKALERDVLGASTKPKTLGFIHCDCSQGGAL